MEWSRLNGLPPAKVTKCRVSLSRKEPRVRYEVSSEGLVLPPTGAGDVVLPTIQVNNINVFPESGIKLQHVVAFKDKDDGPGDRRNEAVIK